MKLKRVTIRNFKRFTDLTVQNIPESARLIVLAGPNGCGKSSFLDALHTWHKWTSQKAQNWEKNYHNKIGSSTQSGWNGKDVTVEFHNSLPSERKKLFYVRSAYRNEAEFLLSRFERTGDPLEEVRVDRMIDNDVAVSRNYQNLASAGLEDLYETGDENTTFAQYRGKSIDKVKQKLLKLFPDLILNGIGNPLKEGTFRFTKGNSKGFHFKNLSGGEKAAFDIILDLVIAKRDYNDTIYCIDEPESHLNARLQANLLSVLDSLLPEKCQLMLATHSIGMMRKARDIEREEPGSVVFLDFGNQDFDQAQVIEPAVPDRDFWRSAYDVALNDLAALVAPKQVVICEGQPNTNRSTPNQNHDAKCYESIFASEFPDTRFVSMGNDREVMDDRRHLAFALDTLVEGLMVIRLIDRDDRAKEEIEELKRQGVHVLSRRNLESYLFCDEVLRLLADSKGKNSKTDDLLSEKQQILAARSDNHGDNLKPASGQIYNACKRILNLRQCGNDARAFMRITFAPLIQPGSDIYKELKKDIFDSP